MEGTQFHQALQRMVTDEAYRKALEEDPKQLIRDYQLTAGEIGLLAAVREAAMGSPDVQGYDFIQDVEDAFGWVDEYMCCY